jgi:hypothetical protein
MVTADEDKQNADGEECNVHVSFPRFKPHATMMKLTVGQFRESLRAPKPVLRVEPSQDKTRMEHYAPLHPQVVEAIHHFSTGKKTMSPFSRTAPSGCG